MKRTPRYRVLSVRVTDEEHAEATGAAALGSLDAWLYYKIFGRVKH